MLVQTLNQTDESSRLLLIIKFMLVEQDLVCLNEVPAGPQLNIPSTQ